MSGISFFTPVKYNNYPNSCGQKAVEFVDDYFYLGGKVAVVVNGSYRNGSQEVVVQEGQTHWLKTGIKILSYAATLFILPLFMLVAKAMLRSSHRFHECAAPRPQPPVPLPPPYYPPHRPDEMVCRAPLTFVRSDEPANLDISVSYNSKFSPREPIAPKPTEITKQDLSSKYTWKVLTHDDGTMSARSMVGGIRKIKMIWWEATRHALSARVDPTQAVCVKRSDMKAFLERALMKFGVQNKELAAFTHYWHEVFNNDPDTENTPYVLVQLVKRDQLGQYLPEMQIGGQDAARFDLLRFYFRFEPISQANRGMNPNSYLRDLPQGQLGSNVVIDLGGEIGAAPEVKVSGVWGGAKEFESSFIREYIYAT